MRCSLPLVLVAILTTLVAGCASADDEQEAGTSAPLDEEAAVTLPLARQFGAFRRRPHPIIDLGAPAPAPSATWPPDMSTFLQGLAWKSSTAPTASAAAIVEVGDLDVAGSFRLAADIASTSAFSAFAATSSEGAMSLAWAPGGFSGTTWTLTVRGATALSFGSPVRTPIWRAGDDIVWRAWYRPSTGHSGMRFAVNGVVFPDFTGTTTGGALVAPSSVSTIAAASADTTYWQTFIARHAAQVPGDMTPEILILGDSTLASWIEAGPGAVIAVGQDVYSSVGDQRLLRPGIGLLAAAGDTTANQQATFDASPWSAQSSLKAVIIQVGINDYHVLGDTAATTAGRVQALVADVRAKIPAAKILVSKLVPFAVGGGAAATFLLEFNNDVMGTGPTPITGVDGRISEHYPTLDDGTGAYKTIYNFDNLHENSSGRTVVSTAYLHALQVEGVLP